MLERLTIVPDAFFARDGKRLSLLAYLFLVVLCVGFFTPGLVTMPPTDRDESLFAQASKQMVESGNYVDIRFQDEPRYKKPVLIYWLQSASARIFEPHHLDEIWAYRVPSFVGATVSVLLTAALGSLLFNPLTGLFGAMMLAGCVLMNGEARIATTDAALLASIMAAMFALARAYLNPLPEGEGLDMPALDAGEAGEGLLCITVTDRTRSPVPRRERGAGHPLPLGERRNFFLFWTAIACGALLKGPIILLPVAGVLLWVKISEKNLRWFRALRPLPGILYALVLIAPWFIAISMQSHGAFMQQSAGHDMLAKIWQGQNRGMMPPGLHLMAFPILFFPFALFAIFAAPDAWKNKSDPAVKFCLGWIIPAWVVFEISLTKLPHYVLPAYPAIALLTAKFMLDGFPTIAHTKRRFPIALIIGFWLMIGVGFAYIFAVAPVFIDNRWSIVQIIAGIILVMAQCASLLLLPLQKRTASLVVLTLGALIFMTTACGSMIPGLRHLWLSREIIEAVEPVKPCVPGQIVSAGYHEPSLVFLAGTGTIMAPGGAEAAKDLKENRCRVAVLDEMHKQEFLDSFTDEKIKPKESGVIGGLNSGHGAPALMTLYVLPPALP